MIGRGVEIASLCTIFGLGLFEDHMHGKWEENQDQRGLELVQFSTRLGPTFSKFLWEDMYGLIFANICDAADTNFVNV